MATVVWLTSNTNVDADANADTDADTDSDAGRSGIHVEHDGSWPSGGRPLLWVCDWARRGRQSQPGLKGPLRHQLSMILDKVGWSPSRRSDKFCWKIVGHYLLKLYFHRCPYDRASMNDLRSICLVGIGLKDVVPQQQIVGMTLLKKSTVLE